jgi:hypothetical protein
MKKNRANKGRQIRPLPVSMKVVFHTGDTELGGEDTKGYEASLK